MKDIEFTAALSNDVGDRLFIITDYQDKINEEIKLINYSTSINHLFIIFQCFPADLKSRKVETFKKMRRKTKNPRTVFGSGLRPHNARLR